MGIHSRMAGLCGQESRHFYAIPTVAYHLQTARPDLLAHTMVENAGAMRQEHRLAIMAALGLQETQGTRYAM
eukprot:5063357-Prorocentrum_lima.AAC.1